LHELSGGDIDQNLSSVAHLQVVVLEPGLDREERLLVQLDRNRKVVVFAHRISEFVKQLEGVHVVKVLLESTLRLLNQLVSLCLLLEAQIEVD